MILFILSERNMSYLIVKIKKIYSSNDVYVTRHLKILTDIPPYASFDVIKQNLD